MRVLGQEPLTASTLAAAPLHEQKQMIGEWLVPLPWSGRGVRHQLTHQLEVRCGDQVPSLKLTCIWVPVSFLCPVSGLGSSQPATFHEHVPKCQPLSQVFWKEVSKMIR